MAAEDPLAKVIQDAWRRRLTFAEIADDVRAHIAANYVSKADLAGERARADRMYDILLALYEHRPPDNRPRVLAEHEATRAALLGTTEETDADPTGTRPG